MPNSPFHLPVKELQYAALLSGAYFVAAVAGVSLTRFGGGVAFIWFATAILVADLRYRPKASWVLRCLTCGGASAVATAVFGLGFAAALPLAAINVTEAVFCALLMRVLLPKASHLETPREIAVLLIVPGCITPAITAFPGAAIAHWAVGAPYWPNWLHWAAGHSLGTLMMLPVIKLVLGGDFAGWLAKSSRRHRAEAALICAMVAATAIFVFNQPRPQLIFLPMLPMMIAVFRLGRLGAASAIVLLSSIGIIFTINDLGPFASMSGTMGDRLHFLQLYIVTVLLMTLPAAAELRHRNKLLLRSEENAALYRLITERSGDIILALEVDGSIRYASPSASSVLGIASANLVGRPWTSVVLEPDLPLIAVAHQMAITSPDQPFSAEFRMIKSGGALGWFESHSRASQADDGAATGIVSIVREISERKAREFDLSKAAGTDPLTCLLNRRGFDEHFNERLAGGGIEAAACCIAVFDLDHFKRINDRFGHAVGDDVLKTFAHLLDSILREQDLTARIGGEEFAALLTDVGLDEAERICDNVRSSLANAAIVSGGDAVINATVSIGLARVLGKTGLAEALRNADRALYLAKANGRNQISLAA